VCKQCDKKFTRKFSLENHSRIHSGEKPYECKQCDKKFTRKFDFENHSRIHSGEKPYVCKQCDKKFTRKFSLENHSRIHSGEKPYECKLCDMNFATTAQWYRHLRSADHQDIEDNQTLASWCMLTKKQWQCRKCHMTFKSFKDHHVSHYNGEPVLSKGATCDFKLETATNQPNDQNHRIDLRGVTSYAWQCEQCGELFPSSSVLEMHSTIAHAGGSMYVCRLCDMTFTAPSILRTHLGVHCGESEELNTLCSPDNHVTTNNSDHQANGFGKNRF